MKLFLLITIYFLLSCNNGDKKQTSTGTDSLPTITERSYNSDRIVGVRQADSLVFVKVDSEFIKRYTKAVGIKPKNKPTYLTETVQSFMRDYNGKEWIKDTSKYTTTGNDSVVYSFDKTKLFNLDSVGRIIFKEPVQNNITYYSSYNGIVEGWSACFFVNNGVNYIRFRPNNNSEDHLTINVDSLVSKVNRGLMFNDTTQYLQDTTMFKMHITPPRPSPLPDTLIPNPGRFHINKSSPPLFITVPPPVKDTVHPFQFHGYNGGIDSSKLKQHNK